jgi:hypothetical protein
LLVDIQFASSHAVFWWTFSLPLHMQFAGGHSVCLFTCSLPVHTQFAGVHSVCRFTCSLPVYIQFAGSHAVCRCTFSLPVHTQFAGPHAVCRFTCSLPVHTQFASSHAVCRLHALCWRTVHTSYEVQANSHLWHLAINAMLAAKNPYSLVNRCQHCRGWRSHVFPTYQITRRHMLDVLNFDKDTNTATGS